MNCIDFASSACVPMTMSIVPSATPSLTALSSAERDETRSLRDLERQAGETLLEGREVLAREQASSAPRSPPESPPWRPRRLPAARPPSCRSRHRRRSADPSACRRRDPRSRPRSRPPGRRSPDRGNAPRIRKQGPPGGTITGASFKARAAAMSMSLPAISRMRCFSRALRDCQATPPSLSS